MPCQNCAHNQSHARNHCARCYAYLRRHGVEPPAGPIKVAISVCNACYPLEQS